MIRRMVDQVHHDPPPVVRVALAPDPPCPLQAVEHARDGPRRESRPIGELAGGHRSLAGDQVRVLVIGGGEPEALGHGGVEQDRRGALAPRRLVQGGEELRARGRGLDGGGRHSLIN